VFKILFLTIPRHNLHLKYSNISLIIMCSWKAYILAYAKLVELFTTRVTIPKLIDKKCNFVPYFSESYKQNYST